MTRLDDHPALTIGLEAAVPLWMLQLAQEPDETNRWAIRRRWARDAVEPIASRGDALQYGGKRGEAAEVFNHLARALAALAFAPGGVTFAGLHWCADHAACLDAAAGITRPEPEPATTAPDELTYLGRRLETLHIPGNVL